MVEFDAFAGGIEIGGLRNMLEIKILICYILGNVKTPMKRTQICDALQKTGLVNYFDANAAIDELIATETLKETEYFGENCLDVSAKGIYGARELENNLLPGVRDRAVKTALNIVARARAERENKVEIKKVHNGYDVTFEIESLGDRLLSLTLNVTDEFQAEQLKDGFLDDPGALYSDIINRLVKE
ncbi:MAG: DUF4364 family protein [Clostridia bacterium]|nr:DUF4364 family protein [Clostridia bacterium]MBQ6837844.1 DUF4364 family protein [Clostridia bacterium]